MTVVVNPAKAQKSKKSKGERPLALRVRILTAWTELADFRTEWQDLADSAVESNSFYEPWFMLPAFEHLSEGNEQWRILIVERDAPNGIEWCGFFPFVLQRGKLTLWKHMQCFLTVPLVRTEESHEILELVFKTLRYNTAMPGVVRFPLLNTSGPFYSTYIDVARALLLTEYVKDRYTRAVLDIGEATRSSDGGLGWLKQRVGGHHLRELRRQHRRLSESGALEYRDLQNRDQLTMWVTWFLEMEADGWKGRDGTALASSPGEKKFFQEFIQNGFQSGAVELCGLFLCGEPIAMKVILRTGAGGFAFKIAFREDLAKYSPGVQLQLEFVKEFLNDTSRHWMDSCASANHPMINRLWSGRRSMQDLVVSTGRPASNLFISALPFARELFRMMTGIKDAVCRWIPNTLKSKTSK
ncbi:MAG: GNAT family N-acetyltransferase [Planctomycetaceae bacterium]